MPRDLDRYRIPHKIVNCAASTDDNDVVRLCGLRLYNRKHALLNMQQNQTKNLTLATVENDDATHDQCSALL